jgi:hypothetical protein
VTLVAGRGSWVVWIFMAAALVAAGALQARLEAARPVSALEEGELYIRSAKVLDRAALSFDNLLADIYWMRAIQHFGGTRRSEGVVKRYELLYPLLDLTTELDPYFAAAYNFGAVFLAEPQPGGAGRPDLSITLLRKGMRVSPESWSFPHQIGLINYWYINDLKSAADWFARAARMKDAPSWLGPLEASTRAEGGELETSRRIWQQIIDSAESDWMRETAQFRLAQIETFAILDQLNQIVTDFALAHGRPPAGWGDLVRDGRIRGIPLDASGTPFVISTESRLHPLPRRPRAQ